MGMAKSLFNSLKVSETPEEGGNTPSQHVPTPPRPSEHGGKKGKKGTPGKYVYSVRYDFESRDQAIAIGRILVYQADRLRDQADKHDKSKLTYISEMLRDQANVIESMAEKIKRSVPN